jgi:hypothetical protein
VIAGALMLCLAAVVAQGLARLSRPPVTRE